MDHSPVRAFALFAAAATILLTASRAAHAQPVAQPYATGLNAPMFLTQPATGDARRFIAERGGTIRVVSGAGALQAANYLDISASVNGGGEGGLLGMALTPNFATSGVMYVHYTSSNAANDGLGGEGGVDSPFDTVIERITLNNPSAATPMIASRQTVLRFAQPYDNHNAGWIGFKPNDTEGRYLYFPTGDGGSVDDPGNRSQNLGSQFGKLLRLDVAGGGTAPTGTMPGASARNYGVPADNFFQADSNAATLGEITALGFRNPFRASFDRTTNTLYVGDVGQGAREEIDAFTDAQANRNYGWRLREGRIQTPGGVGGAAPAGNVEPVFDYARSGEPIVNGSTVTGGVVYRGSLLGPAYQGLYFFADFGSDRIFTINPSAADPETTAVDVTRVLFPGTTPIPGNLVAFGEDSAGEMYLVDIGGTIYRVVPEPAGAAILAVTSGVLALRRRRRGYETIPGSRQD